MFKFIATNELDGQRLIYRKSEYSIDTIPVRNSDICILIDYLQIGFDSVSNACTQIFGFFPQFQFSERREFSIPNAQKGVLLLNSEKYGLEAGDSLCLKQTGDWISVYSDKTKYIYFGKPQLSFNVSYIKFFPCCIAAINDAGELEGLWMLIDIEE
ncbi:MULTISPECIES: hypothetical protein [Streptococcus]|uniref:Uncharacterized protein n=1 Tax=Streptococcus suis TaxID=1307 RepID=A0A4T2H1A2_STRSU|nr:hypothetical protein [Streptococcus suis]MBY4634862.1 hypothetical protein [Streptococcus suis]TII04984.1 hypothetical protein FAJ36_06820 [Streptococcus suis]